MDEIENQETARPAEQAAQQTPSIDFHVAGIHAGMLLALRQASGSSLESIIERAIEAELFLHNLRVQGLALFVHNPRVPDSLQQVIFGGYVCPAPADEAAASAEAPAEAPVETAAEEPTVH